MIAKAVRACAEDDYRELALILPLSLVCHAWGNLLAPIIYRRLHLRSTNGPTIAALCSLLCAPDSRLRPHVTDLHLSIASPDSLAHARTTISRLARCLPSTLTRLSLRLQLRADKSHNAQANPFAAHPSYTTAIVGSLGLFKHVTTLNLRSTVFRSSADPLGLLGDMPCLVSANLHYISWEKTCFFVPRKLSGDLATIVLSGSAQVCIWPLSTLR